MAEPIDSRLEVIVERMFQRCFQDKEFKQAIGIALEARRLDVVEKAVKLGDAIELLSYILTSSMTAVENYEFRKEVSLLEKSCEQSLI